MVVAESSSKSLEETRDVARKVQIEKNSRGGESIKIAVPVLGSDAMQSARPRMIKPKSPKVDRWKINEGKSKAIKKKEKPKVTFDKLLAKYEHGKAGQNILIDRETLSGRDHQNRDLLGQNIDMEIFMQQPHIHLTGCQCLCHGDSILLLVRRGVGADHGCRLLR